MDEEPNWQFYMLVALADGERIAAWDAEKGGAEYLCPVCQRSVVLKKGDHVVHHFAHKRFDGCNLGTGETHEHMLSKYIVAKELRRRNKQCDVEFPLDDGGVRRRADVVVLNARHTPVAVIEIQHTNISEAELLGRMSDYKKLCVHQLWCVLYDRKKFARYERERVDGGYLYKKISVPPYWGVIRNFYCDKLFFLDPVQSEIYFGTVLPHYLWMPHREWHDEYGEECSSGGFEYQSERWRNLEMRGPYPIKDVHFVPRRISAVASIYSNLQDWGLLFLQANNQDIKVPQ